MAVKPIPDGYNQAIPYLACRNAAKALEFYAKAFGATEQMRMAAPDGKIGHAEIKIGNALIMLSDEYPEMKVQSPQTIGGTPVGIHVYVPDVDALNERAIAAGATVEREIANQFYGDRSVTLGDPFGHRWFFATHVEDVAPDEMKRRAEAAMKG
jgi:PhnB protein